MIKLSNIISKRKGFTLLEILMVMVIISILAALAVPQYIKVAKKGHASEAVSNVGDLKGSEIRYYAENGSLVTGTGAALDALDIENPNSVTGAKFDYTVAGSDADDMVITASSAHAATTGITVVYDGSTGEITTTIE